MNNLFSELELLASYKFDSVQPVLVDVGAHHGDFSRFFAERGWQVLAFEPEKKNKEAFEITLSGFQNVSCIAKAVTDISGEIVPFYVSDEHYGIHSIKPFHKTHRLAYEVETACLNDVLLELLIPPVTLVKVDTEGADFLAIKGLDFKLHSPELVMIEFMDSRSMPNFGYSHHDVAAFMKEQGYVTFVSEWAPIKEYGREGVPGESHDWLQCAPYPLDHEPSWGNLIFAPEENMQKFSSTLGKYLANLREYERMSRLKNKLEKIPGGLKIYNLYSKLINR